MSKAKMILQEKPRNFDQAMDSINVEVSDIYLNNQSQLFKGIDKPSTSHAQARRPVSRNHPKVVVSQTQQNIQKPKIINFKKTSSHTPDKMNADVPKVSFTPNQ